MARRSILCLSLVVALAGCGTNAPRLSSFGMPALPKLDVLYRTKVEPIPETYPYKLSQDELASLKTDFSSAFTDGQTLSFGPVGARRKTDGSLLVCGLVSVRDLNASETGMKLFDGNAAVDPFGTLRFEPNRLAGDNGKFLDIYADCRSGKVI